MRKSHKCSTSILTIQQFYNLTRSSITSSENNHLEYQILINGCVLQLDLSITKSLFNPSVHGKIFQLLA